MRVLGETSLAKDLFQAQGLPLVQVFESDVNEVEAVEDQRQLLLSMFRPLLLPGEPLEPPVPTPSGALAVEQHEVAGDAIDSTAVDSCNETAASQTSLLKGVSVP
jgi:hypothetical protein